MTADAAVPEQARSVDPFRGPDWQPLAPVDRRRRRTSRRRLRRRRRIGLAMIVVGAPVVLAVAWIIVTGLLARSQLQTVRAEVHQLRAQVAAGDLDAARATASEIAGHAGRAHWLTTGPAWAVFAGLPGGQPLQTVRTMAAQIDTLSSDVVPQLVTASRRLDPASLRLSDGRVDLARIARAAPVLDRASAGMQHAVDAIQRQPAHSWLGPVDAARSDLLSQLSSLRQTLHSADLAVRIAPVMLGEHGVKRYFVAFQNEAEARGTGGIPGAFAIMRADHGSISFERFESDNTLHVQPTRLDFGAGYQQLFDDARTTSLYVNSNLSPNFPYAAQVWLAMWRAHSGQRLDGALAIDPTALSYLLRVAGPAALPDGTKVTAGNVVALTENRVYFRYPTKQDQRSRKAYLLGLARAVSTQILHSKASTTQLVKAGGRAAGERRLLVYSADPDVQAELAQTSLSGAIPNTAQPYVGLSIVNDGGNKLDYYLDRSLTWARTGCGATRDVTVTVRLTNDAPAGLPPYLSARSDRPGYPVKAGDNRLEVSYYGTRGGQMTGVTVDGEPGTADVGSDLGHPVFTVDVEVPRGTTRTIVFHLAEPGTAGPPLVLNQPLVRPLHVSIADARCG